MATIYNTDEFKAVRSENYSYNFRKSDGFFQRWGKTVEDDPEYSPVGPEILDMEISSVVENIDERYKDRVHIQNGKCRGCGCEFFCYKQNGKNGTIIHTKLEVVKKILDKMNHSLTQVAYGVISPIESHPEIWDIFKETREHGIIPNVTINQKLSDSVAKKLSELCGAIAVSVNKENKEIAYNAIKKLTDLGMKQINIHYTVYKESLDCAYEIMKDIKTDKRLKNMNCIVFLGLKPKGAAKNSFNICSYDDIQELVDYCLENNISFGADSCSAPKVDAAIKNTKLMKEEKKPQVLDSIESCESFFMFSSYINVYGEYYPCSFAEGENGWENGIDVLSCVSFLQDVWNCNKANEYRKLSINSMCSGCRKCLIFDEIN